MTRTPARHLMVAADRIDRRSLGRMAQEWMAVIAGNSVVRIATRPAVRTDRVASRAGPQETAPRVFPRRVFYSTGHPANRNL